MDIARDNKPKVVVLLAVNNGVRWLPDQITSILEQDDVDVSISISIDASDDGSDDFCRKLATIDHRITVLPRVQRFGNAASNFFRLLRDTQLEQYDFVSFSDQDDIWSKNKLSISACSLTTLKMDGYSANVTAFWPDGHSRIIKKNQPQQTYDFMFESAGPGCTYVLTKKLAIEIQQCLTKKDALSKGVELHDWFIYAYARWNGYKWFIDEQSLMQYRQHTNNVVGANIGLKSALSRWHKLRNGWYATQVINVARLAGYENNWPIKQLQNLNLSNRAILSMNAFKFRRRLIDQMILSIAILLMHKL